MEQTLDDETVVEGLRVKGVLSAGSLKYVEIRESHLGPASFVSQQLDSLEATNAVFEDCDFSGAQIFDSTLERVSFIRCRMTGADFSTSTLSNVTFEQCKLVETNFRMTKMQKVSYVDCELQDADFYDSSVDKAEFDSCRLQRAQFAQAKLSGVELFGSELDDIKGVEALRGASIQESQVLALAMAAFKTLGVRVVDL